MSTCRASKRCQPLALVQRTCKRSNVLNVNGITPWASKGLAGTCATWLRGRECHCLAQSTGAFPSNELSATLNNLVVEQLPQVAFHKDRKHSCRHAALGILHAAEIPLSVLADHSVAEHPIVNHHVGKRIAVVGYANVHNAASPCGSVVERTCLEGQAWWVVVANFFQCTFVSRTCKGVTWRIIVVVIHFGDPYYCHT